MPQAQDQGENPRIESKSAHIILLALGSNLASTVGTPAEIVLTALSELEKVGASIRVVSALYSTPAFPAGNGPDFVNAAAKICANWSPQEALDRCHAVEASFGRTREVRWGQRVLDIDLLGFDDVVAPDVQTFEAWRDLSPEAQGQRAPDQLILPHPRMQDRAFVLVPLADVAPDWVHPVLRSSVTQMRDALDPMDLNAVRRLE